MSPLAGIKAILSLIPIHLYLKKLYERFHFHSFSLLINHILKLIINTNNLDKCKPYCLSLTNITPKQQMNIKEPLVNMDNRCNKFILFFFLFNKKSLPGNRIINVFPKYFSFHLVNRNSSHNTKNHLNKLDNIILQSSSDPHLTIVVSNASIRNQVATSISHIHSHDNPVIKTIHHTINVTTTKAKLFAIRYSIN